MACWKKPHDFGGKGDLYEDAEIGGPHSEHANFKNEKNSLETMLTGKEHTAVFFLKFHCELNRIERV